MTSMEIDREDLLIVLSCLGVSLPKDTKIPDDGLNKRLLQALDASQRFSDLFQSATPLIPSDYPKWSSPKPLVESVSRGNMREAYDNFMSGTNKGNRKTSTEKKDTFMEVRQILLGFAVHWDQGHKDFVLLDTAADWAVVVRIVDVYMLKTSKIDDKEVRTPIFGVLYKVVNATRKKSLLVLLGEIFSQPVISISTTELERKTLLKLFAHNAKRLSAEYQPNRSANEDSFRLTFLLPLGPLNMRDLGKLNNSPGCEMCGKRDALRCIQCMSVSYCGKDCQRDDWKNHKHTCRSLKGGSWHTLTFSSDFGVPGEDGKKLFRVIINKFDAVEESPTEKYAPNASPPNVHGEKTFLIKCQISLHQYGDNSSMLIYDRQRSFQVYWFKREDRDVFTEAQKAMGSGLKIYRWARRVGDFQLSVCFDRAPEKDPVW